MKNRFDTAIQGERRTVWEPGFVYFPVPALKEG
jgi:hypothetical protein